MDVELPDGRLLKGVPDGTSKDQLSAKLKANGLDVPPSAPAAPKKEELKELLPDDPNQEYSSILPMAKKKSDGAHSLAVPGMIRDVVHAAEMPGRITAGQKPSEDEMEKSASTLAGMMAGGKAPGVQRVAGKAAEKVAAGAKTIKDEAKAAPIFNKDAFKDITPSRVADMTQEQVKALSQHSYKIADEHGAILSPEFTGKFIDSVEKMRPQTKEGRAFVGDDVLSGVLDRMKNWRGEKTVGNAGMQESHMPITLQGAQEIDEHLGGLIDRHFTNGRLDKDGQKLLKVQDKFREMIESADEKDIEGGKAGFEAWKNGRFLWSRSRSLADIEKLLTRAQMSDNPATAIKTGFRNLYLNEKRMRAFTPKERQLIKRAAESNTVIDVVRTLGSKLVPIGVIAGGGGFGAETAALAGSMASRGLATRMQVGRANEVAKEIANSVKGGQIAKNPKLNNLVDQTQKPEAP